MRARSRMKMMALSITFFALVFSAPVAFTLPASADDVQSAEVGAIVDPTIPPPTTPPTTAPPVTTPPTTVPDTDTPVTTIPDTVPTTTPAETQSSLAQALDPTPAPQEHGIVAALKSAGSVTSKLFSGVLSGRPVADVARDVLPTSVANVVVPAVRTASTFAFPIGMAGAVLGFLVLQSRIDSGDPKLVAAPLAHDDDIAKFL